MKTRLQSWKSKQNRNEKNGVHKWQHYLQAAQMNGIFPESFNQPHNLDLCNYNYLGNLRKK